MLTSKCQSLEGYGLQALASLLLLFCFSLQACSEGESNFRNCYRDLEGNRVFIGSYDCISEGNIKTFIGYWEVGYEHSLFYEQMQDLRNIHTTKAYWLELNNETEVKFRKYILSSETSIIKVRISGWRSEEDGFYGHGFTHNVVEPYVAGGIAAQKLEVLEPKELSSE